MMPCQDHTKRELTRVVRSGVLTAIATVSFALIPPAETNLPTHVSGISFELRTVWRASVWHDLAGASTRNEHHWESAGASLVTPARHDQIPVSIMSISGGCFGPLSLAEASIVGISCSCSTCGSPGEHHEHQPLLFEPLWVEASVIGISYRIPVHSWKLRPSS